MADYWFDRLTNRAIVGEEAYQLETGDSWLEDIVPLADLLVEEPAPVDTRTNEQKLDVSDWTNEMYREYGRWVLRLLASSERTREQKITREILNRLFYVGLGPSVPRIKHRFGQMWAFAEAIGEESKKPGDKYRDWSSRQFITHAKELEARLGRKPRGTDYDAIDGPDEEMIRVRFGGVRQLNEQLGYPDVHSWDKDEFVGWGARVIEANAGSKLTVRLVNVLSKRKRGPAARTVINQFGHFSDFQAMAVEEHEATSERRLYRYAKLDAIWETLDLKPTLEHAARETAARYELVTHLIPRVDAVERARVSQLPTHFLLVELRRHLPKLTMAELEIAALETDTFDYLWADESWREYLHVSPEELGYIYSGNRQRFVGK